MSTRIKTRRVFGVFKKTLIEETREILAEVILAHVPVSGQDSYVTIQGQDSYVIISGQDNYVIISSRGK